MLKLIVTPRIGFMTLIEAIEEEMEATFQDKINWYKGISSVLETEPYDFTQNHQARSSAAAVREDWSPFSCWLSPKHADRLGIFLTG